MHVHAGDVIKSVALAVLLAAGCTNNEDVLQTDPTAAAGIHRQRGLGR